MVNGILRRMLASVTIGTRAAALSAAGLAESAAGAVAAGDRAPLLVMGQKIQTQGPPPTSAFCIARFGIACYAPADIRNQYDFNAAYAKGENGSGQTIVIFDSFGSPTILQDLASFDSAFKIAPPPSFNVYEPEGNVTYPSLHVSPAAVAADKKLQTEIGWAYETTRTSSGRTRWRRVLISLWS